jgi:hypothetical protein
MKNSAWVLIILLLFVSSNESPAQSSEYLVKSQTLNMRAGPGTDCAVLHTLSKGEPVTVLDRLANGWWQVQSRGEVGYVSGKFLARADAGGYGGWEKSDLTSSGEPECFNLSPKYDEELDNFLRVTVGSNTDVVIKLMKYHTNECIRYVYVRSGDVFHVRNIPEGVYYLKIAYGRDWRQKVIDGQCYGKFMRNAQYERGRETLDFRIRETSDGYQIPSFELSLDVIRTSGGNTFHSNNISESEFNR